MQKRPLYDCGYCDKKELRGWSSVVGHVHHKHRGKAGDFGRNEERYHEQWKQGKNFKVAVDLVPTVDTHTVILNPAENVQGYREDEVFITGPPRPNIAAEIEGMISKLLGRQKWLVAQLNKFRELEAESLQVQNQMRELDTLRERMKLDASEALLKEKVAKNLVDVGHKAKSAGH